MNTSIRTILFRKIINWKVLTFSLLFILLSANVVISIFTLRNHPKIGYVDTAFLFEKFKMTTEMKLKIEQANEAKGVQLKELSKELKNMTSEIDSAALEQKYQDAISKAEASNREIASTYNDQIWKQLNQYVKEYSEMNHYTILLGANGAGSVMAADTTLNQTSLILAYANKRYEGQNENLHHGN